MKEIRLSRGLVAFVDDADFDRLMAWKWHAFDGCSGNVYAARNGRLEGGKRCHIFMHNEILVPPPGLITDHWNGNGLDNQRHNLRPATRAQNMWNRAPNKVGSSRHKGVYWHNQHRKWCASIQVGKRRFHIGLFANEGDAARAYAARAAAEFGDFDWSNRND